MELLQVDAATFGELAQAILSGGNGMRFPARGWSMRPVIKNGDILQVEPVDPGEPVIPGEIYLYRRPNARAVAHRLIRIRSGCSTKQLVFWGDASTRADGAIDRQAVLGHVTARERNGRILWLGEGRPRMLGKLYASFTPLPQILFSILSTVRHRLP